jgi:JmjC domain, hydroxylase/Jumonji helical domain
MILQVINVIESGTSCIPFLCFPKLISSLEVSSSELGAQVVRPKFVRELDLIEKVWPSHLRPTSPESANPNHAAVVLPTANNTPSSIIFPKVTLYCLMSVARSYTDFHVDFGGSSVFYHILRGNKTFLFIEPNQTNLRRYEAWCGDSDQSRRFLGEEVKECIRVDLSAGDTMIIPSGWIHAVYTPTDSLVLGGNFLTQLHIPSQLHIANIEMRTRVPKKFRFPFFDMAMWYTAIYYLDNYIPKRKRGPVPKVGRRNTEGMSEYELNGLKILAEWLWKKAKLRIQQVALGAQFHRAKVEVPPGIDVIETATKFAKWVYESDNPNDESLKDLPSWYRAEILSQKVDTSRKRKGDDLDAPVRKYTRRAKKEDDMRKRQIVEVVIPSKPMEIVPTSVEYFSLSRPVTSYSSISNVMSRPFTSYSNGIADSFNFPLIQYPLKDNISTGISFNIFKPYSPQRSQQIDPPGQSFVEIIKSTYRPYLLNTPLVVLEEIKVEDEPFAELSEEALGGLDVLSRAAEMATQPQPDYAPSITDSTLTVYSSLDDSRRLPTPPSQSPPPHDLRETSTPIEITPRRNKRFMSSPNSVRRSPKSTRTSQTPGESPGISAKAQRVAARNAVRDEEIESKRLQGLLTDDELFELRKKRRRGSGYSFGIATLQTELERLGRHY